MTHLVIWHHNYWDVVENKFLNKARFTVVHIGAKEECEEIAKSLNIKDKSIYGKL